MTPVYAFLLLIKIVHLI